MASIHIPDRLAGTPAGDRLVLDELRQMSRVKMEGMTPGQRAARRRTPMLQSRYIPTPSPQIQISVDVVTRQVITRRVAANGQVMSEDRRRARRLTRVHLLDGHMDTAEPVEGVAQACQAAAGASGMFSCHVIGGHGQITVNFVPVSSVVRLEDLRR